MNVQDRFPRLPVIAPESLTERQRALFEAIRSGPRGTVSQNGPFGVYLHAPDFGDLAQRLGAHCRYHTAVARRLSEFTVLVVSQFWRADYEWQSHATAAETAGVSVATIADLAAGRFPAIAPADEQALYRFVTALHEKHSVDDATYEAVRAILGEAGTIELVGIIGYYTLVAMLLAAFRVSPRGGASPAPFPA